VSEAYGAGLRPAGHRGRRSTRTGPGPSAGRRLRPISRSLRHPHGPGVQIVTKFGHAPVRLLCCRPSRPRVYIRRHGSPLAAGSPTARRIAVPVPARWNSSACWRSAPGAMPTRPPSPMPRCGSWAMGSGYGFRSRSSLPVFLGLLWLALLERAGSEPGATIMPSAGEMQAKRQAAAQTMIRTPHGKPLPGLCAPARDGRVRADRQEPGTPYQPQ